MNLDKKDIEILRAFVQYEIKAIEEERSTILRPGIILLDAEEKYQDYLKGLLNKLKIKPD